MLCLISGASRARQQHMSHPHLGLFTSPVTGGGPVHDKGKPWGCDNDCFKGNFNGARFLRYLARCDPTHCLFVACPDVVGDAAATLEQYHHWASKITELGYPVAFVLQNGQDPDAIPASAAAVFVGGTTEYKYSPEAAAAVRVAKRRGLWVHWGRVNTARRLRYIAEIGCDSFDGTNVCKWPDIHVPRMLKLCEDIGAQRCLNLF